MRLWLFIILACSITACSKDHDTSSSHQDADTLATGWKKIQLATSETITDVFFANTTTGYAISSGSIFRSTDGGNGWARVYQSREILLNIAMGNESNAMFTSASNIVFFTNNGGLSFDSIGLADNIIDDAFFVSGSVAYAVGQRTWKTTDAGNSWVNLSAFQPNRMASLRALHFFDEHTGWVTGDGFFKTTNGGVKWDSIPGTSATFGGLGNISFSDATTGYITDPKSIYKTSDGGVSFTKIFDTHSPVYHDIHFINFQTGYITDRNYILKTIDGGQTWTKEVVIEKGEMVELHFTDGSHGWAGGSSGLVLRYAR